MGYRERCAINRILRLLFKKGENIGVAFVLCRGPGAIRLLPRVSNNHHLPRLVHHGSKQIIVISGEVLGLVHEDDSKDVTYSMNDLSTPLFVAQEGKIGEPGSVGNARKWAVVSLVSSSNPPNVAGVPLVEQHAIDAMGEPSGRKGSYSMNQEEGEPGHDPDGSRHMPDLPNNSLAKFCSVCICICQIQHFLIDTALKGNLAQHPRLASSSSSNVDSF